MKCHKIASLVFISCYLVFFNLLFPSCSRTDQSHGINTQEQEAFAQAFTKAVFYENRMPDSALFLANEALEMMPYLHFKSSDTLFLLLEMRAYLLLQKSQSDSALLLLSDARLTPDIANDSLFQAKIALLAGTIALKGENIEAAEKYLSESIVLIEKLNQEQLAAEAYNIYGILLIKKSDNNTAIEFLLKAYKIAKAQNNLPELSSISLNIASAFRAIGSQEDKLRYYRLALETATMARDTANHITALNNLGVHYRKLLPDSALFYYQEVLALSPPENENQNVITRYNIANLYYDQKEYNKALQVYDQILEYCLAEGINQGVAIAYSGIAAVYNNMGNPGKAIDFLKTGIAYADSTGDQSIVYRLKYSVQSIYEKNENFKQAYLISQEIKAYNDSTQALEMKVALHELEIRYQAEKKEAENERLKLEVVNQNQNLKLRAYIIILLFLIALLLLFFLWKGYSLYRERGYAYSVLMKKYEDEKAQREFAGRSSQNDSAVPRPGITMAVRDPLIENLIQYYQTEKPYLDPKLRVDDVAAKMNTSQKAIAAALKEYNNSNFNTFTNEFRVDEAKRIMENLSDTFYKVESVAYDSGFGSKSSFYVAFEQFTGVKPSYYRSFMFDRKLEAAG